MALWETSTSLASLPSGEVCRLLADACRRNESVSSALGPRYPPPTLVPPTPLSTHELLRFSMFHVNGRLDGTITVTTLVDGAQSQPTSICGSTVPTLAATTAGHILSAVCPPTDP